MKLLPPLRALTLSALCLLALAGRASAQTASPGATVPPSKPVTEVPAASAAKDPAPAATAAPEATVAPKKLTPAEKKTRRAERLRKYDTNKDGKLDKEERAAMRADLGLSPADEAQASPKP